MKSAYSKLKIVFCMALFLFVMTMASPANALDFKVKDTEPHNKAMDSDEK